MSITKEAVTDLLENFSTYVNPSGEHDPWFRLSEINQQFAWEPVPEVQLETWLEALEAEGLAKTHTDAEGVKEWSWVSS